MPRRATLDGVALDGVMRGKLAPLVLSVWTSVSSFGIVSDTGPDVDQAREQTTKSVRHCASSVESPMRI
jgi:hypothetical protein